MEKGTAEPGRINSSACVNCSPYIDESERASERARAILEQGVKF